MSSSSPFQNTGRLKDLPKSGVVSTPELTGKRNSRRETESLVAQIHQSASIQSERVQAIVDGAILAVEQVQDKRIDVLEKGPEVTISDVIFDVLLSLCLMGVGKALVPITESIAKELVQTASYYGGLRGSKIGAGFRFLARVGDQEFAKKFGFGEINPKIMASYHQYCRDVLTKSVAEKLEQGTKAVLEKAKVRNDLTHEVNLEPTDTPGVAILGAAQSYASSQRSAITLHHAGFEAVLRSDPDSKALELIRKAVTWPALNDEIIAIRDKHKMLFEAVIWAQLFGFARDENIIRATGGFSNLKLVGVTDTLVDYWRHRFARVITEWVVSRLRANDWNAGRLQLSEGIATFGGEFGNLPRDEQVSQVNRFFMEVARNLGTLAAQGIGKGSINVTQPPIPKK